MVFAARGFADDLSVGPAQLSEVIRQRDAANRAAAEEPQPLPMGISFRMRRDSGTPVCVASQESRDKW